jgi:hypothetical protein
MNSNSSNPSAAAAPIPPDSAVDREAAGAAAAGSVTGPLTAAPQPEFGGRKDGTDPTRFGDWEKNGRCVDF